MVIINNSVPQASHCHHQIIIKLCYVHLLYAFVDISWHVCFVQANIIYLKQGKSSYSGKSNHKNPSSGQFQDIIVREEIHTGNSQLKRMLSLISNLNNDIH